MICLCPITATKSGTEVIAMNFVAVMFIVATQFEVFSDFVAILGIIARNMPLWQRNRKKRKMCCDNDCYEYVLVTPW